MHRALRHTSLFGSSKVKTLERENATLHQTVATHEETIETLQSKIQTIRTEHSRQMLDMQQKHIIILCHIENRVRCPVF
ncbi:MAG: hypothetical protein K2P62_00175 [Phocaeicola sp.]|nr:hypothetical protein [Phocaeicola sp.]